MLAAYYGMGEDASHLFQGLEISKDESYDRHLNQYHCLLINVQDFLSISTTIEEMLRTLQKKVSKELMKSFPDFDFEGELSLIDVMDDIFYATKKPFVILIDEWDCIFRVFKEDFEAQKKYLDFLRLWLKDKAYVGLAYMTGILPIKKYGTHSALNMFWEYSMIQPSQFMSFFGFTSDEVQALVKDSQLNFSEIQGWYNGYFLESGRPIFNPTSVIQAIGRSEIANYWNETESFEALKDYIRLDYGGLKEKITCMIAGETVRVNTSTFSNDMTTLSSEEDVLTLLIHLGYLSYNDLEREVRIPNEEVRQVFAASVKSLNWDGVASALQESETLLKSVWAGNEDAVAKRIQKIHEKNTSILQYNNENSLAAVLNLAFFTAMEYYVCYRELPTGKGFADLVYLPRKKHADKPALIVELKWNQSSETALSQIKSKNYPVALEDYYDNLLLIGIIYNKTQKTYECSIEKFEIIKEVPR